MALDPSGEPSSPTKVHASGDAGSRRPSREERGREPTSARGGGEEQEHAARVRALEADRVELLGRPVSRPADEPNAARFEGSQLSEAMRAALEEERVAGDVEGVDCSEFPCILFVRLEGDEEDVEELERSEAFAPYRRDVLTLLLWAVSADDEGSPAETALVAMAFYTRQAREALGERLDRRIRARVLEVWNTDRPARQATARP